MHIAIVTAGGAGMFCGSCMHDNTWARALIDAGLNASLIPTYTPIRVDEELVSDQPVLLGGINVYLDSKSRIWSRLPRWLTGWLDHPRVLNLATRWGVSNDASQLGPLTIDMLRGADGPHHREVEQFVAHLAHRLQPDAIIFSNALLAGVMPSLRTAFDGPILCTLQGDDIFLEGLLPNFRAEAIQLISRSAQLFDGFLTHSRYYRDFMREYLQLGEARFHQVPLSIDLSDHDGQPRKRTQPQFTIGYFARICPEKGLHRLVEAFRRFRVKRPNSRLLVGGYLGQRDTAWFNQLARQTRDLGDRFEYIGSPPTHHAKVEFLSQLDVLSVPTEYREPKGLYVLESLANGTPVVQPAHGAFPELIEATGGGLLFDAESIDELVEQLVRLHDDEDHRLQLARAGYQSVRDQFSLPRLAETTRQACNQSVQAPR